MFIVKLNSNKRRRVRAQLTALVRYFESLAKPQFFGNLGEAFKDSVAKIGKEITRSTSSLSQLTRRHSKDVNGKVDTVGGSAVKVPELVTERDSPAQGDYPSGAADAKLHKRMQTDTRSASLLSEAMCVLVWHRFDRSLALCSHPFSALINAHMLQATRREDDGRPHLWKD